MCMANLDSESLLREANVDFLSQFDRRPQDGYDRPFLALLHPSVRERVGRELTLLANGQRERYAGRVVAVRQDGELLLGDLTAIALPSSTGGVGIKFAPARAENYVHAGQQASAV
jgi:hypothetical protein